MTPEPIASAPTAPAGSSYLEWGAVFGGAAVAIATSVTLAQFGATAGLGPGEAALPNGSASWQPLLAGLWLILVALSSASAGAYVAGRMRSRFGDATENEVEFRDGAHGLVVWAVATIGAGVLISGAAAVAAFAGAMLPIGEETLNAPAAAERIARNASTILGFATAAGAALSAAGAWQAAKVGGEHRDRGISVNVATPHFLRGKTQ